MSLAPRSGETPLACHPGARAKRGSPGSLTTGGAFMLGSWVWIPGAPLRGAPE